MDLHRLLKNISELMHEQRYDEAAEACRHVITVAPHSAFAHVALGDIRRVQGRLNEAVEAYREAITLKPKQVNEIREKLDETIDAISRQKVGRTASATLSEPDTSTAPPSDDGSPPAEAAAPMPLPETTATVPVHPMPAADVSGSLTPPPEVDTPQIAFPEAQERPPMAPAAEGGFSLQSEFLTPLRMYLIIAVAVVVVLISVLMNGVTWHHRHRATAKMTPIPLEMQQQPVSLAEPLPAEMPKNATQRK